MSKKASASQSDNRRRSSYIICQNDVLVFGSQKKLMEIYETLSDIREQRDLYENDWLGWLVYSYDEGNDEVADCYAFLNEKPVLLRDGNVVECLILSIETEFVPPFKLFEWMEQTLDVDVDYFFHIPNILIIFVLSDYRHRALSSTTPRGLPRWCKGSAACRCTSCPCRSLLAME